MVEGTSIWRGRRVLVTGCTGFLGGAVARELLASGAEVVGLVNERPATDIFGPGQGGRVHLIRGRTDNVFRLHSAMAVHEVAAVFHLAAPCLGPSLPESLIPLRGTVGPFAEDRGSHAVLQAAKLYARRVPIVTARPSAQLGIARTEEAHEDGLSVVRFGEVFGPGDRKVFRVVPATAIGLITGEGANAPSDGAAHDYVFIRDAARACIRTAEMTIASGPGEHTFRSGWLMTERQMAAAVRDVFASRPVVLPDSAPATNPGGWQPQLNLSAALEETIGWYREFLRAGCAVPVRIAA